MTAPPSPAVTYFVKERIWPMVNYEPHEYQRLVHAAPARHRVVPAGRRFGKSHLGGHELTLEILKTQMMAARLEHISKRREFWIVGPEYSDAEKEFRVFWDDCKRLEIPMDKPGSYNNPESGEMVVSAWNGRFKCFAKSAKYPGTLVGEGLSGVILSEAAKLKPSVWTKYIRPTLSDFKGWSLHTSTPEGKNWFYDSYKRGQDPTDPDWWSKRMPAWLNPIVYPLGENDPEIVDLKRDMSEEKFNQEIGADFSEFVGRVFKQYDPEIHVADLQYDPRYPVYAACDYGWTNPFVWLLIQVDVWDNVYVLGEYRVTNKDTNEICRDLETWKGGLSKKAKFFYPDPAEPGDTEIIRKHLGITPMAKTGGELKHRLEMIRQKLRLVPDHVPEEERMPKIFFDRSCNGQPLGDGGLLREMEDYRYPENKSDVRGAKEQPMDIDDHGPEALGRFFRGYYGQHSEARGRTRVTRANIRSRA